MPTVIFQVPLDWTSIKNYPKDDVIQAVTMEELKSALYNLSLQNFDTLQDQKIIIVIFLLLSKVSGRL